MCLVTEKGRMVIIEVKDENATFLCTDCQRTISTGQDMLVSSRDLPKNRVSRSGDGVYYNCICGSRYELIKSSNPSTADRLKFKHVRIVELGYGLNP